MDLSDSQRAWFWRNVTITEGCWTWNGGRDKNGYGRFNVRPRLSSLDRTHRVSWVIHFGAIPEGLQICHHCDNPPCVRPDHLFLGTAADNNADKVAKGRQSRKRIFGRGLGLRNGRYTHPETTARGDRSGMRMHPESVSRGSDNGNSKLVASQVVEIRRRRAAGESRVSIAADFGISPSLVRAIAAREIWRHVA